MKLSQFDFNLPKSLISFYPNCIRSQCRLMTVNGLTGQILHKCFFNIIDYIYPGDLIIFNDTQVIPARLYGQKKNGKKIECLVERIIAYNKILVKFKKKEDIHIGTDIFFGKYQEIKTSIIDKKKSFFEILFYDSTRSVIDVIHSIGMIPLPPYIKRPLHSLDQHLYQTIYKKHIGSIAAPTAGLHFDFPLLDELSKKGIDIDFLTLHIGYGTFQPIQTPNIIEHAMHTELVHISSTVIKKIQACKKKGGRIIAVGTSTLRALESLYHAPEWKNTQHFVGETNIFIYPGYQHNIVDALITNFHVPKSTLIMLVASFVGYQNTMHAYIEAIKKKYYFLSYGDAMYITYNHKAKYEKIL